jgi:ABC-type branched-subunit amino acid transport system ATPase component
LTNVSFKIGVGELVGIIGPNGAGKTTLFNALNGIIVPNGGQIHFDGQAILGRSSDDICRRGIARTFQTVRAFPHLTLLENVVTGAFAGTVSDDQALAKARSVLAKVGLLHRIEDKASDLTARDLRLMELARALACEPQLLLLDECLAGLSTDEVEDMINVLQLISKEKITIVIIEHTMHAMVRLAQRLIVLDHGEVIASGEPKDVLSEPNVISAYLGRRWAEYAPG